jgi:hypothetical protein
MEIDSLSDEFYLREKTTELAGELQILALYKTVEISIKGMLKCSELFTENQILSCHKIGMLKDVMSKKVCDIETLAGYSAFDELRCINNCVKHSGKVNKQLAKFSKWTAGELLKNLHHDYGRLRDDVHEFIFEIRDKVLGKLI